MAHTVAPNGQEMTVTEFDLVPSEQQLMAFKSFDVTGHTVHGLLTDRRLVLRASQGVCAFPLNLCCVCFKAEADKSYAILDLKSVEPYVAHGCVADCMGTMFDLAKKPGCCCLPKLLPNGIKLGFSRPGDLIPSWMNPATWVMPNNGVHSGVHLQLHREDAIKLRKLLATHPNASGLKYTVKSG